MRINDINEQARAAKKPRRVGRGIGSGRGKTSQRGHKGQGSRSGSSMNPVFEGGQMPLARRIPKRGFNNAEFSEVVVTVNIGDLELFFEKGDTVSPETLRSKKVVKNRYGKIKILGDGQLSKNLDVTAHAFSASAKERIEAIGGKVTVLPAKKPVVKNKMGSRLRAAKVAKSKS